MQVVAHSSDQDPTVLCPHGRSPCDTKSINVHIGRSSVPDTVEVKEGRNFSSYFEIDVIEYVRREEQKRRQGGWVGGPSIRLFKLLFKFGVLKKLVRYMEIHVYKSRRGSGRSYDIPLFVVPRTLILESTFNDPVSNSGLHRGQDRVSSW